MDDLYSTCNDLFDSNFNLNKWLSGVIDYICSTGWIDEFDLNELAQYLNEPVEGFYEYYQDINQLIDDILRFYHQRHHRYYIEMLKKLEGTLKDKIVFAFLRYIERDDLKFDIAIRNFARKNINVNSFLKRLDKQKINSLINILLDDGFSQEEAETRANLLYYDFLGKMQYLSQHRTLEKKMDDFIRTLDIIIKKFES